MKTVITLIATFFSVTMAMADNTDAIKNFYTVEETEIFRPEHVLPLAEATGLDLARNKQIVGEDHELTPAAKTIEETISRDAQITEAELPESAPLTIVIQQEDVLPGSMKN